MDVKEQTQAQMDKYFHACALRVNYDHCYTCLVILLSFWNVEIKY